MCCILCAFSSAHPRSPPLLRLCSPPRGLLSLSSLAAVAVVSPSARGVASGTAAAALLLRLLGEGALRCYFFFLSKKRGFFSRASPPAASGRLRAPPVASGRLRSPPVASGRLRSTSLAWRVPDGGGISPGAAWVGLVWVCGEIAARKRVCVLNSLHWVVTTLAGALDHPPPPIPPEHGE